MQAARPHPNRAWEQWAGFALILAALAASGALLVAYALLAWDWYQRPFLGFFPSRNLTVTTNDSLVGEGWPALDAGIEPGDRLILLDGMPLSELDAKERLSELAAILDRHEAGDTIEARFVRADPAGTDVPTNAVCLTLGEGLRECTLALQLSKMPEGDWVGYFGIGWVAGLALWLITVALLLRQRGDVVRYVALLALSMTVFLAGQFDAWSTHRLVWVWQIATCLLAGQLVLFGLEFPYRFASAQQVRALRAAPLVAALALSAAGIALYQSEQSGLNRGAFVLTTGVLVMAGLILGGMMIWRRARSASPVVRNQSTVILIGLLPFLIPVFLWLMTLVIRQQAQSGLLIFNQVLPILLTLSIMYAVVRVRLVDTDRVITNTILYGALLGLLLVSYWLTVTGVAMLIGRSTRETALSPVLIAAVILVIAVLFTPLRAALQQLIDATYFRTRRSYRAYLERFSRDITNAVGLDDVILLVKRYLADTIAPTHVIMFVRDIVTYEYRPEPDPESGLRPTDITFSPESGLVRHLRDRAALLYLEEGRPLPLDVVSDRARLAVLGAPVIIRLKGQKVLNGFLAIGPRQGGGHYLHEDLRFIENLSDQIALAVERAQVVDDLERRVRVQDVLSQVSRALNFAIDFDTLLELIYAQTIRVINAPHFYIALRNPTTDELTYVFYNEGVERVEEKEGRRWRMGRDLISEIARTQQTIRTDDYVRETLLRDPRAQIENPNLKAWMGVPLLADTGGGVLGVMVAATTEPGVAFTDEQQELFWDIANLAATAIDKLQLFEKTQQRARQLSAINEITGRLASELGNVKRLLQLITENAVQILGAEAGSLLLVDEETGDLKFNVVVGGGGQDLVGKRIPAGTGLAGATIQRSAPIIVNDPTRDSRWYGDLQPGEDPDAVIAAARRSASVSDETLAPDGFQSNAILSVPLIAQNRAIGVLQTINKRDGSIFVREDAELLETFARQAAIAIENARLFDMTDQQLAARVQELDTMQRIDQELNRTLNLSNVVDITMDWALRRSGASAGALFMLDRERSELRLIVSYGYEPGMPFDMDGPRTYPLDRGVIGRVVRTGQPSLITNTAIDPDYDETYPGCKAQLIVPLYSANQVIGVMILESERDDVLDLLDLDFVARLAEHASPAIVNSQLFSELQLANQAKSEFVSFVAHELKNPMTSMRGYTDLLLQGVVGPVNPQQSDFLTTIFNNVVRMETLVSDLNDLTKQQTNNLRLDIRPVDFFEVVNETVRAQKRQIDERQQTVILDVPEDLPLVRGDYIRLVQIMTNFISNAHKYTPEGGTIRVLAEIARNTWDPHGPPDVLHCSVADTGIGMSEEDLAKLFTPYFRSDNPKAREQPGTGLGMSITRGLIEQHGGRIWVESTVNVGTTFHFTLPLASEQEQLRARIG